MVFTEFISGVQQQATMQRILPAGYEVTEVSESVSSAEFEPSPEEVLEAITYRLVEAQVYHAPLTARAGEHIMRMLAMKNATQITQPTWIDDLTRRSKLARAP